MEQLEQLQAQGQKRLKEALLERHLCSSSTGG